MELSLLPQRPLTERTKYLPTKYSSPRLLLGSDPMPFTGSILFQFVKLIPIEALYKLPAFVGRCVLR